MQPNLNPREADCLNHGSGSVVSTERGASGKTEVRNPVIRVNQAPGLLGAAFESQP
jgi:hypothetical protein